MTLQAFHDYRDKMLSIMEGAEDRLGHAPPADSLMLDLSRNRMARILTAYHLFAERELFGPCATRDPAARARAKVISAECAQLAQDFRAFARACTVNPVLDRWPAYRLDALAMMGRIRQHLAAAEVEARFCTIGDQPAAPGLPGYRTAA